MSMVVFTIVHVLVKPVKALKLNNARSGELYNIIYGVPIDLLFVNTLALEDIVVPES